MAATQQATRPLRFSSHTQCHGKMKYPAAWMAEKDAVSMQKLNPGKKFVAYPCPHCRKYHIGTDCSGEARS